MIYWRRYRSPKTANICIFENKMPFWLLCTMVLMFIKITLIFVCSVTSELFWCFFPLMLVHKVYTALLNCNLPMTHTQAGTRLREGYKSSFKGCMVAIINDSYILQAILVKGNIIGYFSFFDKIRPMKKVCLFK